MIYIEKVIRKMLNLDEHDKRIEQIKEDSHKEVRKAIESLRQSGAMERKVMKQTTTHYMVKAMGGIR